ncbi:Bifunctional monothiol glutaredoxin-S16, chloroplastic [Cymbomonas tetramitiformis]|uniref:Bifunctional monothiol glutaredoxin-S16, chloroplastic n=1 Tax=Cymbomonas tetramitiformis TaxID=36881 RepID=A0AAE0FAU7_9CHLO|nr:Bifunctional monothiol glutaredoxin-S16, chloroplastic [Cymbomonas tetramitiformis]
MTSEPSPCVEGLTWILGELPSHTLAVAFIPTYNPGLRETIKTYSQWPTIPQVYCNGEFMGGADIIIEMHEAGELKGALQSPE